MLKTGNAYIRQITLNYGRQRETPHTSNMSIRSAVMAGDMIAEIPASHSGKALASIVIVADPGSIASETRVELDIGNNVPTGSDGMPAAGSNVSGDPQRLQPKTKTWPLIASTRADPNQPRHVLAIGREKGPVKNVEISARNGALAIIKVRFILTNNEPIELDAVGELSPTARPLSISLDQADAIREIVIVADPKRPQTSAAVIEVRAQTSETWAGAIGENRIKTGGWVLLGTVTIANGYRDQPDRKNFVVDGAEGRFQRLRLVARRQAVTMLTLSVDPGDGKPQSLPVNATLQPDINSAVIALPAANTPIARVTLQPVIRSRVPIDAAVEVWAQY